jgi:hypothetical protein
MLPVFLDCLFLIAPSVFSYVYLQHIKIDGADKQSLKKMCIKTLQDLFWFGRKAITVCVLVARYLH